MTPNPTKASLIIPTFNRKQMLFETLQYIDKKLPPDLEVLVIDQSDETEGEVRAWIQENMPLVRYFRIQKIGLPNARNFGITQAKSEILLFCDDDVVIADEFFQAHIKNFANPEVGGVVGQVLSEVSNENSKPKKPTGKIKHLTANQIDHFNSTVKQEVDHGQGCNFSFRKTVLERIGGFDTRFGGSAFLEDTDICLRVKQAGFKIMFEPEAKLIHFKSKLGGCRINNPQEWYYWYGHNYMLLFLKHFSKKSWLPFFIFRFGNLLKGAITNSNPQIIVFGLKGMLHGYLAFKNGTR